MMPLPHHVHTSTYSYWSPICGAEVTRVSMVDDQGQEYWTLIDGAEGAAWVRRKREAFEMLVAAIEGGLEPGEIRIAEPDLSDG